ncbi:MAG: threonine/homoserine/homoserine lactone efflux protein [Parvicellaceae bacterium]|jgi:threonine/homoserine/homoserine lactone efflux protein
METTTVLSFLAASIALTIMPGPDNLFVLTESLTKGVRNGIAVSVGLASGVLLHTLAAALGLSFVIQNSELAFSVIKYLGTAYLLYLAFKAYQEKRPALASEKAEEHSHASPFSLIRKGFLMNVLNPKVSLFFIALLPQFLSEGGFRNSIQMILLGVIFMLQALVIFSLISLLSGSLTKYVNDPKFWNITKWSKVGVLSILGLVLALSRQ